MRRRTLSKIAPLFALLGCLALAPSAAALTLNNVSAQPADNDAGAHSNISIHLDVGQASEDIKDLTIHLPPGVVGDPTGPEQCSETQLNANSCPAGSQVGTSASSVLVGGVIPQNVSGNIYNVTPRTGEPARFGIVLNNPLGSPIILQSPAALRTTDYGLDSILTDIPNTASGLPIDITSFDIVLFGQAAGQPFMRNPTSCQQATTNFDATSYTGSTATGSDSFTPDNCAALDFSPELDVEMTAPPIGTNPELVTTITQGDTEAGMRRAEVRLPSHLTAENARFNDLCPTTDFNAGTCPPQSVIGSAVAASPLQNDPVSGPVVILQPLSPGLPDIGLDLRGPLALKLRGDLGFSPDGRSSNIFNGLPDIPISEFTLTFTGGPGGFLQGAGLCENDPAFDTIFDGHNGEQTTGTVAATLHGCIPPTATARVKKRRSDAPRGRWVVTATETPIVSAEVRLPKQLRFAGGKAFRKGADASDSSGPLPPGATERQNRSALVTSDDAGGTDEIVLLARKGALQSTGRGGKPSYELEVTDADGRVTTLTLP